MISQQGGLGRDGTTKWDQVKIIPDELPDYGATGEHQCGCTVVKLQLTLNNTGANCTGPLIHKFFFLNALMVGHPFPPLSYQEALQSVVQIYSIQEWLEASLAKANNNFVSTTEGIEN